MTDSATVVTATLPEPFGWLVLFIVLLVAVWGERPLAGPSPARSIRLAAPHLVPLAVAETTTAARLLGASLEPWLGDDPEAGLR